MYTQITTPIGVLILTSNGDQLTGCFKWGQKHFPKPLLDIIRTQKETQLPILEHAKILLNAYFDGQNPDFTSIALHVEGTVFQRQVWAHLSHIPYGQTTTYGHIAHVMAQECGHRISAQAIGNAIGRNPILIFTPCHRVIAASGALSGYVAGLEAKQYLLTLEAQAVQCPKEVFFWRNYPLK